MANLLYEDYDLKYPGDFRISEVALSSPYGGVAGITSNISSINIYEDIDQNCLTGDITFTDTANLVVNLPIIGNEYLNFKIRTPMESQYGEGEYDFTNVPMAVFNVSQRLRLNSYTQTVTLEFCSPELIRNQSVRVSRAFEGPYDDAVAKIFKKSWGLNSKKKIYIQPTKHNHKFVAPNRRPMDVIQMLANRAVPKTSVLPGYRFYENGQGFHFRSIDSFYFVVTTAGLQQHPDMFEYFCDTMDAKGSVNVRDNPKSAMRFVDKYSFTHLPDLIASHRTGAYANKTISHDSYNKTITTSKFNYIEDYNQIPHMEKDSIDEGEFVINYRGLIPKAHYDPTDLELADTNSPGRTAYKMISDYSDARVMLTSNTAKIHNTNSDSGNRSNEYTGKRQSANTIINSVQMNMTVPGNTHLNIGHMIKVNVPRSGSKKDDTLTSQNDKMFSGRWLITAIRHNFDMARNEPMHKMVITCSKETYAKHLADKRGLLQLPVADEGKAVNIYDRSEYN